MSLQKGLIGHWTASDYDIQNGILRDRSGNGHHGSITGATEDSDSTTSGGSLKFDSATEEVNFSTVPIISNEKTLSFWMKSNRTLSSNDEWEIGFMGGPSNKGTMFGLMYGVGGCQDLGYWGWGGNYDYSVKSKDNKWSSNDKWINVILEMDPNNSARLYIDNSKVTSYLRHSDGTTHSSMQENPTESGFKLNSRKSFHSPYYVKIDDIRLYDRTLSKDERNQIFQLRDSQRSFV